MCLTTISETATEALKAARYAVLAAKEEIRSLRACTLLVAKAVNGGLERKDGLYFVDMVRAKVLDLENQTDAIRENLDAFTTLCDVHAVPERPVATLARERIQELFDAIAGEEDRAKDCGFCGGFSTIGGEGYCIQCGRFPVPAGAAEDSALVGEGLERAFHRRLKVGEDNWRDPQRAA